MRHATEEEIAALQKNYVEMVASKDNMQQFHHLDQVFHDMVPNGTRNPMIIQISKIFTDVFVDNQKLIYHNVGPESAIFYHGKMLEAVKERNGEVASIYARMSIEESMRRWEEQHEKK